MLKIVILIVFYTILCANAYSNKLFNLVNLNQNASGSCGGISEAQQLTMHKALSSATVTAKNYDPNATIIVADFNFSTIAKPTVVVEMDPFEIQQTILNKFLFGSTTDTYKKPRLPHIEDVDILAHYPTGNRMRAEVFQNKSGVHLPRFEWLHRGHCYLNTSMKDFMQTAVNAFAIFIEGDLNDVLRMPSMYVLRSARTIAMMRVAREKLVATWEVVKGDKSPSQVTYQTLEYYRPLFKYVNGREMSRLNLDDDRILSFVGTHSDLNRHQVGVIASKYIEQNKNWRNAKYLNLMNNLLCGVPMKFMRRIPESIYLQLSHQLFYHIKACDPLQRRFYLAMMTRTQVLGKSNSWSARDVARLGLLLTEVDGPELSAISPVAMAGISSQVMMEMSPRNLKQLTKVQLRHLGQKPLNILIRKINDYDDELQTLNAVARKNLNMFCYFTSFLAIII